MSRKSKPASACSTPEPLRSNSVPRTHDPVTRTLKYVDPGHRFCVPNFAAASFTPKDKHSKYHNLCHSSCGVIRMTSGDLYAIPHPQVLTGYKAKNASGQSKFSDVTLVSGRPRDMKTPMSTNQRYMKLIRRTPGMSNASLFAGKLNHIHSLPFSLHM
ncbi:unnamed protein product [Sphagnum compactum]